MDLSSIVNGENKSPELLSTDSFPNKAASNGSGSASKSSKSTQQQRQCGRGGQQQQQKQQKQQPPDVDVTSEAVLMAIDALGSMREPRVHHQSSSSTTSSSEDATEHSETATICVNEDSASIKIGNVVKDVPREPMENHEHFLHRVSNLPYVSGAFRAYENGKNVNCVVKYGANLMENSVKTISGRVVGRENLEQLDAFGCRQLDRLGQYGKENTNGDGEKGRWQGIMMEAGSRASGLGGTLTEEGRQSLQHCIQWIRWALKRADAQISYLRRFIDDLKRPLQSSDEIQEEPRLSSTLNLIKRDLINTIRRAITVIDEYAGRAVPRTARDFIRRSILQLPCEFPAIMQNINEQQKQQEENLIKSEPNSQRRVIHDVATRLLAFSLRAVDMLQSINEVLSTNAARAEIWVEEHGSNGHKSAEMGSRNEIEKANGENSDIKMEVDEDRQ